MRFFCFVLVVSVSAVQAQYDVPPEEAGGQGNPYYDGDGAAPPQYEGQPVPQEPDHREPPPPLAGGRDHDAVAQRPKFDITRRSTLNSIVNESFTLPPYYLSITTTQRTIKINRRTYAQFLETLAKDGALRTPRVIQAFQNVDRGHFVHPFEEEPYGFMARKLGRGVFMEKPHMQARMIELLAPNIQEGANVLEIGAGTGFMSCVFAELAGKTGSVLAIEHMREQCEDSWDNIMRVRPDLLKDGRLHLRCRDGRVGAAPMGPFDAIYYAPFIPEVPYAILLQLKPGGRLICGIGKNRVFHRVVMIERDQNGESFHKYDMGTESFINPLCNAIDQNDNWLYQQSRRRIIEAKNQGFSGIGLARKLRLYTKKPADYKKLHDDAFKFVEVKK